MYLHNLLASNLYTMWIITIKHHIWVAISITILTTYKSISNKWINALKSNDFKANIQIEITKLLIYMYECSHSYFMVVNIVHFVVFSKI